MYDSPSLANEVKQICLANSLFDGIEDNNLRQITYLLENKKANPNYIIPDKGISPLHYIAGTQPETFTVEATKLFLLHNGDPNVRSVEGATPLHIASAWGQGALVELLLASGADPGLCDEEGLSALDYASREQHQHVVQLLQQSTTLGNHPTADTTPQFSLLLEKVIVNEGGDYAAEYVVDMAQVETKSISTQTGDDSEETVVIIGGNLTPRLPNESWERTSQWCEQQSQLMVETSKTPSTVCKQKTATPLPPDPSDLVLTRLQYPFSPAVSGRSFLSPNPLNFVAKRLQFSPNRTQVPPNPSNFVSQGLPSPSQSRSPEPLGSEAGTTSSEAFFTCESRRHTTVSSNLSSAVSEVYKYTDRKHNIVLIEKRLTVSSGTSATEISESEIEENGLKNRNLPPQNLNVGECSGNNSSVSSSLASERGYCTEVLRRELAQRGCTAGPITKSTKRVYLRRLACLQRINASPAAASPAAPPTPKFSRELERSIRDVKSLDLTCGLALEQDMCEQFANPAPGRRWREGVGKCSFTYLLLDPRVSRNLPLRAPGLSPTGRWSTFLRSVFYVGKGKRARPYSHLYEAVDVWNHKSSKTNKKVERILEIWGENQGVVCLHIFQSIIPVEAYTREAAMIDAIGLENLSNLKRGEYYGVMASKAAEQRRLLGVYLLYRAMHILLHEGERQLQPLDIA